MFNSFSLCQVDGGLVETNVGKRDIAEVFPLNPEKQEKDGVPDNTMMDFLHEPNLLHNLSVRYSRDEIYTFTAYILIAINPYKTINIYDEETMKRYHKKVLLLFLVFFASLFLRCCFYVHANAIIFRICCQVLILSLFLFFFLFFFCNKGAALAPHVFAVAERAYRQMIHAGRYQSQSIICSGDSGSGKTESAKYLLRYLTTIADGGKGNHSAEKEEQSVETRILEANPIMEAFGNAKTLRNNNSSRFGKFVKVHFSKESKAKGAELASYTSYVVGADITTYLLEKPRLTLQPKGERNFHIFYQVFILHLILSFFLFIILFSWL
jgi:myosin heavy subunit